MKKQIDKFEVVYFKSQDRDSFLTEDIDYIKDLIDHLEMWDYPFIEEVNMILVYFTDGEFDMVWTSEEGIINDPDEL